jgi:hypothetical protein
MPRLGVLERDRLVRAHSRAQHRARIRVYSRRNVAGDDIRAARVNKVYDICKQALDFARKPGAEKRVYDRAALKARKTLPGGLFVIDFRLYLLEESGVVRGVTP